MREGIIDITQRRASILALLVMLVGCSQVASAADIPSNASGDYVGGGWSCRVLAYNLVPGSNVLDLTCTDAGNEVRVGQAVAYGCPQSAIGTNIPLAPIFPGAATTMVNVASYAPYQFTLAIGATVIELDRVQTIASPRPYAGCGTSTPAALSPHYPRTCRLLGIYCGG